LLARYVRMHDAMYNRAYKELKQAEKEAAGEDAPDSNAPKVFDPFGEVEVLDLAVGRAGAPNEANPEGPIGASGASPWAAGVTFTDLKTAPVDVLGPETGVTGPSAPLGTVETPPARGS
jgi:hypothetical protein